MATTHLEVAVDPPQLKRNYSVEKEGVVGCTVWASTKVKIPVGPEALAAQGQAILPSSGIEPRYSGDRSPSDQLSENCHCGLGLIALLAEVLNDPCLISVWFPCSISVWFPSEGLASYWILCAFSAATE